jgi:putative ABC transport system permease protein
VASIWQDLRYGMRLLARAPGFTTVTVVTLALGISATAAMFSVVYAVLLRPLPYAGAGRIVSVTERWPRLGTSGLSFVPSPEFALFRNENRSFENLAAYGRASSLNLKGIDAPERAEGLRVSASFFLLLGVQPFLGRAFSSNEDRPGGPQVAVLSYGLWQRRFGSYHGVIGRSVTLDGATWTVIGVMPRDFQFPD